MDLPLKELARGQSPLASSHSLNINGQLRVSDSLVLLPTDRPASGTAGQIYYDNGTNELTYYNGTQFVSVGTGGGVQSIGGLTGTIIPVGAGLTTNGGQLRNAGVLAVQGQTGNISFIAGQGVAINGTTFSNTGVLSVGGQTGDITIGNGITMSGTQLSNSGVLAIGGQTGSITVGNGLSAAAGQLSNTGVLSVDTVSGAVNLANSSATGSTITIDNASTTAKGIAEFNATNFSTATGIVNTIQNINTTATPTFGQLTLTAGPSAGTMLLVNNTNSSATGKLIDLQSNGVSEFSVTPSGNMTTAGGATINGALTVGGTATIGGATTIAGNLSLSSGSQYQINGTQISSSNLSDGSNLAKLGDTQTFTGTNTFKPSSNSATAFQVQNAAASVVLNVDTTNSRVGIGNATPAYALDVTGDVNISDLSYT